MDRHRKTILLRGTPGETRDAAVRLVDALPDDEVLWVTRTPTEPAAVAPNRVSRLLGKSYAAVVLDFHDQWDADLLGQSHGFVWGGGALVLRMPPEGEPPQGGQDRLAVHPYSASDVGHRFHAHVERALGRAELAPPRPVPPAIPATDGTPEQATAASRLGRFFVEDKPGAAVLTADRGRGKSSALGMAVRQAREQDPSLRVAVTAGSRDSAAEVFRFALGDPAPPDDGPVCFVPSNDLVHGDDRWDVVVVDEAAQLPVPVLQRIATRHASAKLAFATTTHGYEGTGRGFTLRFVDWLRGAEKLQEVLTLREPIRWGEGDPLERFVFDALLLDAEPADFEESNPIGVDDVEHVAIDRDRLIGDEELLHEFFGLLVHAHYRTTPGDLRRILDAPNLHLHALLFGRRVVAATLVAEEGGLPAQTVDDIYWGRRRVRGHALAETLVSHLGRRDAGRMKMIRSVRIATHPALRRRGLGTHLIGHVHRAYEPDLFGTLFGATAGLLQFRRRAGYELVRVGASRGSRTGEPAAVMVRPVSARAKELLGDLRADLARDLPLQLELLEAGNELLLDPALRRSLVSGLPTPSRRSDEELDESVALYAFGPRTYEAAATALERFVARHAGRLGELEATERALIDSRIVGRRSWADVTKDVGMSSVRVTMRALRRAVRALVRQVSPSLESRADRKEP